MSEHKPKEVAEVIKKIPLFKGFSPTQIRLLLGQCTSVAHESGDILCECGQPSLELYILISGELAVVAEGGLRLATITPVTTVGEMGVITGLPRSATVEVTKPATVLGIQKVKLDTILRGHRDLKTRLYENVISMLADKLVSDNVRLRDFLSAKMRFDDDVQSLRSRLAVAVDLLAEKGVDRDQAEAAIEERLKSNVATIMVVEDELATRTILVRGLDAYSVQEASHGREALEMLDRQTPELVVTDIRMPEMDGIALLAELRKRVPGIPVIAISGYVDMTSMMKHPFDAVIEKPVSIAKLKKLVSDLLEEEEKEA